MSDKVLKVEVEAKSLVELDSIEAFQDEIKTLSKERYENLKNNLAENGISFCLHIWQNDGKNYLIDGHQRVFAMKQMRDNEGWKIPKVPVSLVKAKSFAIAKRKVLAGMSVAGKIDQHALENYFGKYEIDPVDIFTMIDLPAFDVQSFLEGIVEMPPLIIGSETAPPEMPGVATEKSPGQDMPSGSFQVKQVQLFFNADSHAEFLKLVSALCTRYKTENVTDTVLGALREAAETK